MKINKVEIQAFKTYLYRNNGTFDFTISSGDGEQKAADFVSIYAPNGFGKTSFYDAVDFALTHNITRYIRDTKISRRHNKDAKNLNKDDSKQFLIRNREADTIDSNLETSVSVFTDNNELPFISPDVKARSGNKDYHFDDSKTLPERRYFRDVMLTQEMIDTFLREASPEDRYEKFSQSPTGELQQIEDQRKQLSRMCQDVLNAQKELERNKKLNNTELLKIDTSETPFDEANQLIGKLKENAVIINKFHSPYSATDRSKTVDQVSIAKNQLTKQGTKLEQDITNLQNFLVNFDSSQLDSQKLVSTKTKLKKTIATLENIDTIESLEQKNNNILIQLKEQSDVLTQLQSYQKQVADFVVQYNKMNELNNNVSKKEKQKAQITKENELYKSKIQSLINRKTEIEEKLKSCEKDKLNLPGWFNDIATLKDQSLQSDKRITEIEIENNILKEQQALNVLVNTKLNNYSIESVIDDKRLNVEVGPLNKLQKKYSEKHKQSTSNLAKVKTLEQELQAIQLQSNSIAELISKASEIIAVTQQSDCPLCQQSYDNFEQLKQKIYENPALSLREQALHHEIQELREIEREQATVSLRYKNLKQALIDEQERNFTNIENKLLNLEQETSDLTLSKKSNLKKKIELLEKTSDKTQAECIADIGIKIDKSHKLLLEISGELDEFEKQPSNAIDKIDDLEIKITDLNSALELQKIKINQFTLYTLYLAKLISFVVKEESIGSLLLTSIEKLDAGQVQLEGKRRKNNYSITGLESTIPSELQSLTKTQLQQKKIELDTDVSHINSSLFNFNAMLRTLDCVQPEDKKEWRELREQAKSKLDKLQDKIQYYQELQLDLSLLGQFSEKAINYCQRLDIESEIKKLEIKIDKHQKIYDDLSEDLLKTNKYIQNTADSYFKTELINQIYRAIDPHPDYKQIVFKCHIPDDGKPQLNITAVSSDNNVVSPNLNFSTAQINVLSLSIFLARALTTTDNEGKPVNSIFIDDPIQSMDSINVLSLIDLLRNISSRFGKQLIISTHDENFHELLKKKIPPNIFRAKYLRLASFGQVAYD